MPRYRANVKIWLGHECRMIEEGAEFETTFPKAKKPDGSEVDMKLGENIELLGETENEGAMREMQAKLAAAEAKLAASEAPAKK